MNDDKTSTPEESDGRGAVVSGEQTGAAAAKQGSPKSGPAGSAAAGPTASPNAGSTPDSPTSGGPVDAGPKPSEAVSGPRDDKSAQAAAGSAAAAGSGPSTSAKAGGKKNNPDAVTSANGSSTNGEKAAADPAPSTSPAGSTAESAAAPAGSDSGPLTAPVARTSLTPLPKLASAKSGPGTDRVATAPQPVVGRDNPDDTPTARFRVASKPNGSASRSTSDDAPTSTMSGMADAARALLRPGGTSGRTETPARGSAAATTAAPSVPSPGPGAATPPPWNRAPGQDTGPVDDAPPHQPGPAGGLLDGPTAYMEPDSRAAAGPPADRQPAEPKRSWSTSGRTRTRPPRQAALQLKRLDPWSVLKLALVLAVVIFFIWLVAVGVLYGVLDGMGVWDRLNGTYADLVSGETPTGSPLISAGRVFGLAAVVGAINSLLFAVAVTVGAFVYNVSADLVGGVEVTLSERD